MEEIAVLRQQREKRYADDRHDDEFAKGDRKRRCQKRQIEEQMQFPSDPRPFIRTGNSEGQSSRSRVLPNHF